MKLVKDIELVSTFSKSQRGVFSRSDLETLLADPHPSALGRRLKTLISHGTLIRALRGWYVTADFDPKTLSRRLAPDSYLSMETVLGERGVIGPRPELKISAVKVGPSRQYRVGTRLIEHLGIQESLFFGWSEREGVREASKEKALLDALYFYLHGRALSFDPFADVFLAGLDVPLAESMLERYENPKFVQFVRGVLQ
ncbi:MAG: hypothetical protein AAF658_19030 [Myxococcota bacterium]